MSESAMLPSGWALRPIRDTVVPSGSRNPKKEGAGSFRYVDVDALDNTKQVIGTAKEIVKTDAPSRARMLIKRGDVLFCLVRPYLKNIAIVPRELDGEVASTAYCVLRPIAGMDSRFLFYQIVRESFIHSIPTYGNSPPSARDDEFMGMPIYVAPLPEQRRIVAKIEELFSDLDAGVTALERVKANLKRYRAAVLKAAVEGRLTEEWRKLHPATEPAAKLLECILAERRAKWEQDQLRKFKAAGRTPPKGWKEKYESPLAPSADDAEVIPQTWCVTTIDQLSHFVTSGSRGWAEHYSDDGPLFIRAQDINSDRLRLDRVAHVHPPAGAEVARTRTAPGDLLVTVTGANVTKTGFVEQELGDAYVSQHVAMVRLVLPAGVRYIHTWVVCPAHGRRTLEKLAYGAGKPGLNLQQVRSLSVWLPPLAEQAEIVAEVDRRLSVADAAETQVEHALQRAARLRQAILKRAFEGKLVPQDPTDEPAAALLKRSPLSSDSGASRGSSRLRRTRAGA